MKKLIGALVCLPFLMLGCKFPLINLVTPDEECKVCDGVVEGESVICDTFSNPCAVYDAVELSTEAAILIAEVPKEEYEKWKERFKVFLNTDDTISGEDLKLFLAAQVAKLNQKAGVALLILADDVNEIPNVAIMKPYDKELLKLAFDTLCAKIERLYIIMDNQTREDNH